LRHEANLSDLAGIGKTRAGLRDVQLATRSITEQIQAVKVKSLEAIFRALQEAEARYLVVSGVAVVAHGYVRLHGGEGLDLILNSSPQSHCRALDAIHRLESILDAPINAMPMDVTEFEIQYAAGVWKEVAVDIKVRVPSVRALIALVGSDLALDRVDTEALCKLHLTSRVQHPPDYWPCDWDGHEFQQLRQGASRSFRENLIWLEDAAEFAEKFSKAPWQKGGIQPIRSRAT
jgi:hypothetical protein